jgi:hypothetical protein
MPDIEISFQQMGLGNCPLPPGAVKPKAFSGKLIPFDQWQSTEYMLQFVPRGKCQFTQPSCNSYATGKTWQTKYALTVGKPGFVREVSYSALHQEITGGNMDEGSMPLDAIRINQEKGLPPVSDQLPEWFERTRPFPPNTPEQRKLNRADEWEECPSGAYVGSAIQAMQPCNIGVWWYDSDVNPGPTGELKVRGSSRLGGHAIVACGIVMGYRHSPRGIGIIISNSHGDSKTPSTKDERGNTIRSGVWGNDGFGILPIERLDNDIPTFGAFALRSVMVNDGDLS